MIWWWPARLSLDTWERYTENDTGAVPRAPLRQKSLQQTRVDVLERTTEFNSSFIEIRMDQQCDHQVEGARRLVVGVARGEYASEPGLLEQHPGGKPRHGESHETRSGEHSTDHVHGMALDLGHVQVRRHAMLMAS